MSRRTQTITGAPTPSKRRSDTRPRCPSIGPEEPHPRCLLDPGHATKHFNGVEWGDTEAAEMEDACQP